MFCLIDDHDEQKRAISHRIMISLLYLEDVLIVALLTIKLSMVLHIITIPINLPSKDHLTQIRRLSDVPRPS